MAKIKYRKFHEATIDELIKFAENVGKGNIISITTVGCYHTIWYYDVDYEEW